MKIKNSLSNVNKRHYEVEKKLAEKLKSSKKIDRKELYSSVYEELFEEIRDHPQLITKDDPIKKNKKIKIQVKFLKKFVNENTIFSEIGPGDCSLSFAMSDFVKKVYAFDVSKTISYNEKMPNNFKLILYDGCVLPVESEKFDVIFSNQLIEHLHVDDVVEQAESIYKSIKKNGCYICFTPNMYSGPHDVSKYFDNTACGLHLKEYTNIELMEMFRSVGFKKIKFFAGGKGFYFQLPFYFIKTMENLLSNIGLPLRKHLARLLLRPFLGVRIVCFK